MEGKVVLVTGANTGIGKATALELARRGATVVITARNESKGEAARAEIQARADREDVGLLLGDFASFAAVRQLAEEALARYDRLDVLINNAGLVLSHYEETEDGNEMTFQVNHLSPFLLTHLLLERLKASAPARIINVSSDAHRGVRALPTTAEALNQKDGYSGFRAYSQSKVANILFSRALARRLEGTQVTANALHPGVVRTRLGADGDVKGFFGLLIKLFSPFMLTSTKGARTSVYLASSPEVDEVSGKYFARSHQLAPSRCAQDDQAADALWELSLQLTGLSEG